MIAPPTIWGVDRIPPNNLEAEMALLGSILVDKEMMATVSEIVRPADFYASLHETIFLALYALYEGGKPLDKVALAEELRSRGMLDKIGGLAYISSLMETVPTAASAEYYAKIVREKAALRGLIHAGTEIAQRALDGEDDVEATFDRARRLLDGVRAPASVDEVWPNLVREVDPEPVPPPMPIDLLPEPLRRRIEDVCNRMCVPVEMLAAPSIVALATVVSRTVGIRPKRFDDWLVVPNLWGAVVARPGLLKTPSIAEAMKPLARLAELARERFEHDREHADERLAIARLEVDVLESSIKAALKKSLDELEINALRERFAAKKCELENAPAERRFVTYDATTEKLGELLRENPRGLLQLRDELAGWLRLMDRSGHEGDRAFYLEGWNGTGSYTFDRIGRGTIHIPALTLNAFGGITPGALRAYINEALGEGRGADGLLQRLQVIVWPGTMPEWKSVDRAPDAKARDRVFSIFERLDALDPAKIGAVCGDESEIPYVRFAPDGQILFDIWHDELEQRLRGDDLHDRPAFESHIAKFRSLMPSLALLFHLVGVVDGSDPGAGVSADAARLAAAWCEYLEIHATRVYAPEGSGTAAGKLARRIETGDVRDGDDVRTIYRHCWPRLDNAERVTAAARALEGLGWVKLVAGVSAGGTSRFSNHASSPRTAGGQPMSSPFRSRWLNSGAEATPGAAETDKSPGAPPSVSSVSPVGGREKKKIDREDRSSHEQPSRKNAGAKVQAPDLSVTGKRCAACGKIDRAFEDGRGGWVCARCVEWRTTGCSAFTILFAADVEAERACGACLSCGASCALHGNPDPMSWRRVRDLDDVDLVAARYVVASAVAIARGGRQ